MKNKFLVSALALSMMVLAVAPTSFAVETNTATVTTSLPVDMTDLTLSTSGDLTAAAFTLAAYTTLQSDSIVLTDVADKITVLDETGASTGFNGHNFTVQMDVGNWSYTGNGLEGNASVDETYGSIDNGIGMKLIYDTTADITFAPVGALTCGTTAAKTASVAAFTGTSVILKQTVSQSVAHTNETCPGTTTYEFDSLDVVSGILEEGSYSNTATFAVDDGQI